MLLAFGCAMYRRRRLVLALWGLVLLLALPIVPRVFRSLTAGGFTSPDLEAFRAGQVLADRFGSNASSLFLVYDDPSGALSATDPRFLDQVEQSLVDVRQLPFVERIVTAAANPRQIAPDGRAQYATLTLAARADNLSEVVPGIERALHPTESNLQVTSPVRRSSTRTSSTSPNATSAARSCCRFRPRRLRSCWYSVRSSLARCPAWSVGQPWR